jgi:hypothetical protein
MVYSSLIFRYLRHIGSKPISIKPLIRLGKSTTSQHLDDCYLQSGVPVDKEARMRAVNAYIADVLVDTGELDLTIGRTPAKLEPGGQCSHQQTLG